MDLHFQVFQLYLKHKYTTKFCFLQPASLADQLAEAKEQLSSALQKLGEEQYYMKFVTASGPVSDGTAGPDRPAKELSKLKRYFDRWQAANDNTVDVPITTKALLLNGL